MAGQVRVDQITDEAGTGSPDFINGITVQGTPFTSSTLGGNYIQRTYTGPATWDKPAGLKAVKVTVVGGGGGGGGATGGPPAAPQLVKGGLGGGAGASIEYIPAPSIPGPVAVTVGSGGAGGPTTPASRTITAGSAGGTSSFGSFLSATGGAGAAAASSPAFVSNPGAGGAGSGGDLNFTGGQQEVLYSSTDNVSQGAGRVGGTNNSILSTAVNIATGNGAGITGANYGGGGSGAQSTVAPSPFAGGTGGVGVVIIEEFY